MEIHKNFNESEENRKLSNFHRLLNENDDEKLFSFISNNQWSKENSIKIWHYLFFNNKFNLSYEILESNILDFAKEALDTQPANYRAFSSRIIYNLVNDYNNKDKKFWVDLIEKNIKNVQFRDGAYALMLSKKVLMQDFESLKLKDKHTDLIISFLSSSIINKGTISPLKEEPLSSYADFIFKNNDLLDKFNVFWKKKVEEKSTEINYWSDNAKQKIFDLFSQVEKIIIENKINSSIDTNSKNTKKAYKI